ncbi:MAG TPA: NRDE family protein [Woeseiaceae bacterium]
MCLIALAWRVHPAYPLVVAANRDEFHRRPADPLHWWTDQPNIAGGRDQLAGGTWLGVSRNGRFATVTNYRENLRVQAGARSRGSLVTGFLSDSSAPLAHLSAIEGNSFAGFNLLTAVPDALAYRSNRGDAPRILPPGIYGLSNASLDAPWWKVERSKWRLRALLDNNAVSVPALFELLADREPANAPDVSDDVLPPDTARAVSAPFIVTAEYGTRCSTVMLQDVSGNIALHERRFDAAGRASGESALDFKMDVD